MPPRAFVELMSRAYILLTDSGGLQKEAPTLRKPVLILWDVTERPEWIESGHGRLRGRHRPSVVSAVEEPLDDPAAGRMKRAGVEPPLGEGRAAERIADTLLANFLLGCGKGGPDS
jgi:UDP-N-acetylglucosamine 2-epimerase (non-hydrolysing)